MSFDVYRFGKGQPIRTYRSIGHALRLANKVEGYVVDDAHGICIAPYRDCGWEVSIGGEVTGRHWKIEPWSTEELTGYYPTIKAGEVDGQAIADGCPSCDAGPERIWPLMRSVDGDCLCECGQCGRWAALEWVQTFEPFVRLRRSGLST